MSFKRVRKPSRRDHGDQSVAVVHSPRVKATAGTKEKGPSSRNEELLKLLALARQGDQSALKELIRTHKGLVRWKLNAKLKQNVVVEDIEELTNTVFYRMSRALSRLKETSRFIPWLIKIAVNVANSCLRLLARRRKLGKAPDRNAERPLEELEELEELEDVPLNCQSKQNDARCERRFEDRSIRRIDLARAQKRVPFSIADPLLRQIFKSIPAEYRNAVWEQYVNELQHKEIARKHGWSTPAVSRQKLHQALRKIQKLPLPVITVEIDDQGKIRARRWNGEPVSPDNPFASI